ncbi:MAG TPA: hypothetical protein DIT10_00870 [Chryseobacterium sp.]|uniref:hypothetical protein n=1 Tax=Chryseobacterium lactis TaxID=1241981 RepID=UPI000EE080CD|nr:hypothetical protein [Chryseobacterium lactis]HCN47647.1 hypothetical protein [Chryseobacterium sp.]
MANKKSMNPNDDLMKSIEKEVSKFSQHLMSNAKWIKLIDHLVNNMDEIKKIQFKRVQDDRIGELYLDENSSFEFDYWQTAFEGINSFGGWLQYKEIEYLSFPEKVDSKTEQDLEKISIIIQTIGEFYLESDKNELKLICYKE